MDPHRIRATAERFKTLPEERRRRFKVVRGHLSYGIHEFLPQGATYITMLRDPVSRFLSSYSFILRRPLHPLHWKLKKAGVGIEDFMQYTLHRQNLQCRVIAGVGEGGTCDEQTLAVAKENLTRSFSVVGLSERFQESLVLIATTFGWNIPYYENRKVSKVRPALEPRLVQMIQDHNQLDMQLYEFGRERFEKDLREKKGQMEETMTSAGSITKPGSMETFWQSTVGTSRFLISKLASAL